MILKNKKAEMEQFVKRILWIIFFLMLLGGVALLIRFLTKV